ncbi:FkbM family methyltransferase [Nocardioides sp. cx-173]|uniref:FkbM family methyltransferase n=1 Tax=Nocardioides sp. cx-173 TaxID=2898796 RepID=UPI001E392173|nr:FkbM family methyltransferase [Nocardioides sp. cx-173]MCD4527411.1 FkbM family methyltransferase [Nocardioides sp. cx-173]UGB41250.1 FkbM family methyltransferase [Nocardioides sp. cx-173]
MTPVTSSLKRILSPKVAMRLRAEKNRRDLFGLHAPARVLADLVPRDQVAVDAGANAGLYTYWIATSASHVHAFEPQPAIFDRLKASAPSNVTAHRVALSDTPGTATLHVPETGNGEASLHALGGGRLTTEVTVELRTLDSYNLDDIGFLKVDVEGHEEELLRGAAETIRRHQPVLFMEIEERHNPGGIERIVKQLSGWGYRRIAYMQAGRILPFDSFDIARDQTAIDPASSEYANNFVFRPGL